MGDNATLEKYRRCPVLLEFISSFEDILEETGSEVPGAGKRTEVRRNCRGNTARKRKERVTIIDDKN